MSYFQIGEFEELVLLAICGLKSEAYAVSVQQRLETRAGRPASMGAIYTALDRLEKKRFIESHLGNSTAQRGGRRKRFYRITHSGLGALEALKNARERLWQDIDPDTLPEPEGT